MPSGQRVPQGITPKSSVQPGEYSCSWLKPAGAGIFLGIILAVVAILLSYAPPMFLSVLLMLPILPGLLAERWLNVCPLTHNVDWGPVPSCDGVTIVVSYVLLGLLGGLLWGIIQQKMTPRQPAQSPRIIRIGLIFIVLLLLFWGTVVTILLAIEVRRPIDEVIVPEETEAIKQQLKDGNIFSFIVPEQIKFGTGTELFIGIRNTQANPVKDRICFRVEVRCLKPFEPNTYCDPVSQRNDLVVGGYDSETGQFVSGWFSNILGEFDLKNDGYDVFTPIINPRGVKPQPYSMRITAYKEPNNNACADQAFGQNYGTLQYSTRTFVLNIA